MPIVPERFRRGPAAAAVLLLAACGVFRELGLGGDEPQWQERRYTGIGPGHVLQLAQTVVEDRYPPRALDAAAGTFATDWVYGAWAEVTHQALRQRVLVESEGEGAAVVVRLRVQQETSQGAGRLGGAEVDDWEPTEDDPLEARRLLTRLHVLLTRVEGVVEAKAEPAGS